MDSIKPNCIKRSKLIRLVTKLDNKKRFGYSKVNWNLVGYFYEIFPDIVSRFVQKG